MAIGRNMERHRHQGFIRFLNAVNAQVPRISTPSSTARSQAERDRSQPPAPSFAAANEH
jgi:hypothetical protein